MSRTKIEKAYWDKNAQDKDVDIKYISDAPTELCLQDIGNLEGKVLEIGCGVGRLLQTGYTGLDTSYEMIKLAQERGHKDVVMHDGRHIPFTDESFDNVYSYLVFQHLPQEGVESYINEAYRVLKPNGVLTFQFIEGTEQELFSYHYPKKVINNLLKRYKQVEYKQSVAYSGWTICKAVK